MSATGNIKYYPITIKKFVAKVKKGKLNNGFGVYFKDEITYNQVVYPEDILKGLIDYNYTHIVWLNN